MRTNHSMGWAQTAQRPGVATSLQRGEPVACRENQLKMSKGVAAHAADTVSSASAATTWERAVGMAWWKMNGWPCRLP